MAAVIAAVIVLAAAVLALASAVFCWRMTNRARAAMAAVEVHLLSIDKSIAAIDPRAYHGDHPGQR